MGASMKRKSAPTIGDFATAAPYTTHSKRSLADALALMHEHQIRHLPVLEGGRLVGIVSERDLLLIETIRLVDPAKVPIEEAMTADPYIVERSTPVLTAAEEMWRRKLGSAVVVEKGEVVGVFTTTDALQVLIEALSPQPGLR